MAGVVNPNSELIVTGGGGGGSNVTIVGPLGQKVSASSIPVVIASDQSPIPVTGASGGGPIFDGANPAIKATVFARTDSNPLAVELVNSNGDIIPTRPLSKELYVTLIGGNNLQQATNPLQFDNQAYPVPGEGGPLVGAVLLLNDEPNTSYNRAPGDATNGMFVQEKDNLVGPTVFSNGVGGPINIDTFGTGFVYLHISGTATGSLSVQAQYSVAGSFFAVPVTTIQSSGGITSVGNYWRRFNDGTWGASLGIGYDVIIPANGINVQINNSIASGSVTITAVFKRNEEATRPAVIQGGPNGYAQDVNAANQGMVSLLAGVNDQQWQNGSFLGDGITPGSAVGPIFGEVLYIWNGSGFDRLRGDSTNGIFTNLKAVGGAAITLGKKSEANSFPVVDANLATAQALGSGFVAAPTTTQVGALGYGYDNANGAWSPLSVDSSFSPARLRVAIAGSVSATAAPPVVTSISVLGTVGASNSVDTTLANSLVVALTFVTAGASGSFVFEGSNNSGTNFETIYAKTLIGYSLAADGSMLSSFDFAGLSLSTIFIIPCGGFQAVRIRTISISGGLFTFNFSTSQSTDLYRDNSVRVTSIPTNAAQENGNLASLLNYTFSQIIPLLTDIRTELRILNEYSRNGFNIDDETESFRRDPAFTN